MAHFIGRRSVLLGAAIAAAPAGSEAAAQTWWPFRRLDNAQAVPVQHEGHAGHAVAAPMSAQESAVVAALGVCDSVGEACLTHCLALLGEGDASMAACARGVRDMLAVCRATQTLVQGQSALAGAQLALCRDACSACAAACAPHASHHAPCAACAEQCRNTVAAIDALMT
jgi:Cys-rich four helix bundle protein (predicted Tat secretion target)